MAARDAQPVPIDHTPVQEDTALRRLTPEDRDRIGLDAWEPSLLRKMLKAQQGSQPKDD